MTLALLVGCEQFIGIVDLSAPEEPSDSSFGPEPGDVLPDEDADIAPDRDEGRDPPDAGPSDADAVDADPPDADPHPCDRLEECCPTLSNPIDKATCENAVGKGLASLCTSIYATYGCR